MKRITKRSAAVLLLVASIVSVPMVAIWAATSVSARQIPSGVQRSKIDDSTGSVELVAAVDNRKIQVWQMMLATSATTMEFKSGSTSLTGAMPINAIMQDAPFGPVGGASQAIPLFETATGEAFNLTLSGAVAVRGQVSWTTAP